MMSFKNLKLLSIDNDDVMFYSSPLIQFHVEKNFPQFATRILRARERTINVLGYEYDKLEKEIERARKEYSIPNLPNFNVVRNDVIRESADPSGDFEYEYYRKPLVELGEIKKKLVVPTILLKH